MEKVESDSRRVFLVTGRDRVVRVRAASTDEARTIARRFGIAVQKVEEERAG